MFHNIGSWIYWDFAIGPQPPQGYIRNGTLIFHWIINIFLIQFHASKFVHLVYIAMHWIWDMMKSGPKSPYTELKLHRSQCGCFYLWISSVTYQGLGSDNAFVFVTEFRSLILIFVQSCKIKITQSLQGLCLLCMVYAICYDAISPQMSLSLSLSLYLSLYLSLPLSTTPGLDSWLRDLPPPASRGCLVPDQKYCFSWIQSQCGNFTWKTYQYHW